MYTANMSLSLLHKQTDRQTVDRQSHTDRQTVDRQTVDRQSHTDRQTVDRQTVDRQTHPDRQTVDTYVNVPVYLRMQTLTIIDFCNAGCLVVDRHRN